MIIVNSKRLISLLTVLTLLVSALIPHAVHAHLCAGSEAVTRSLERNEHHHEDADEHDHHAGGHHDHGDHHAAEPSEAVTAHGTGHADEMSYCCYDGGVPERQAISTAVLPSRFVLAHALALLHVVAPSLLFHFPEQVRGDFKIGASPPFLASSAHSTYLRISVLLI